MDDNFYKKFDNSGNYGKGFSSSVLAPFISGLVGAVLVISICFGVPSIKNKLLSQDTKQDSSFVSQSSAPASSFSLENYSDTAIYAANKALPSIVGISISYNVRVFGMTQTAEATGSGVIINKDGYILTNNHVVSSSDSSSYYQVSEAKDITVSLYNSDEKYNATIIGTDALTDLAVIKIDADNLTVAELGDSSSAKIGQFVLAVGNPLGLDTSVTSGIISALDRDVTSEDGTVYNVMQTDCAINSGNSGGALVNSNGEVIGINTLKLSGTGIEGVGFAIPINSTVDIFDQLIKHGKVLRPYIGISGSDLSKPVAERYNLPVGIYVESISEDSDAINSGLKKGDVITAINGTKISTMKELNNLKNQLSIGDTITLTVYRSGEDLEIKVKLKEMP